VIATVLLEQRVTAVETNTLPGTHDLTRQVAHPTEDTNEAYDLTDIDPLLSNGSEMDNDFVLEQSMAGPRSLTPRSLEGEPLRRRSTAISTATLLSAPELARSCDLWFGEYHTWFPLMHQQTLTRCLEAFTNLAGTGRPLVLQAITAATIESSNRSETVQADLRDLRIKLKESTILAALNSPCLDAIQALLVLSMLQYGNGCLTEAGNLLAMCRKYVSGDCKSA
jgi:hypothetical protein